MGDTASSSSICTAAILTWILSCTGIAVRLFTAALFPVCIAAAQPEFRRVQGGTVLSFPQDHGAHPEYETEWWYYTGHLKAKDGREFGFQLTFFRVGVDPYSTSRSAWQTRSLYLAHFALTDDTAQTFHHSERLNRGAFGDAGAAEDRLAVWNGNWSARMDGTQMLLSAETDEYSLTLALQPAKPLVLQGVDGFSRKAEGPGEASMYYSYTRLEGKGSLILEGRKVPIVSASAWMDREFTSSKLAQGTAGWDWFAVQLDTNEEIMVYHLRRDEGKKTAFSSGRIVAADGSSIPLAANDFKIRYLKTWTSPRTGVTYPFSWLITIPKHGYQFEVHPTVAAQELETPSTTSVTYWEGRSRVRGERHGVPISGNAYVELVGYNRIR